MKNYNKNFSSNDLKVDIKVQVLIRLSLNTDTSGSSMGCQVHKNTIKTCMLNAEFAETAICALRWLNMDVATCVAKTKAE